MSASNPRNSAVDFVKGVLVLVMVVYHVMSIMSTATAEDFRYIRFISGSFIFLSGYILARFFESAFRNDPGNTSRRLIVRGLKVLAIFTALNLLIHATGFGSAAKLQLGHEGYWSNAASIYFQGNGRISSFVILLPIAYLLITAPAILFLTSFNRPVMALLMLVVVAIPAVTVGSAMLEFMLVGATGVCAGLLGGSKGSSSDCVVLGRPLAVAGLVLSLWFTGRFSDNVATYPIGIALVLKCLYDLAPSASPSTRLTRCTVLLGRYSLASYIAQIVLIQVLFRLLVAQRWPLGPEIMASCVAVGAALVALCLAFERLRGRSIAIDRSYRLIFS